MLWNYNSSSIEKNALPIILFCFSKCTFVDLMLLILLISVPPKEILHINRSTLPKSRFHL